MCSLKVALVLWLMVSVNTATAPGNTRQQVSSDVIRPFLNVNVKARTIHLILWSV